ncbi:hypothetical protein GH714_039557 [Hevea brasiliensis]|uniref:Protein FAM33A n=1 Tax=Hevea brasiliensis TaxID=3981 RepID=A0A6A6KEJ4_HEVBR|nr:hypothetical protein GH714_039557 [Hevea brasiliensis]
MKIQAIPKAKGGYRWPCHVEGSWRRQQGVEGFENGKFGSFPFSHFPSQFETGLRCVGVRKREMETVDASRGKSYKLVNRIKKMQEDLTTLKEQCRKLLSAKEIIDEWTIQVRSRTGNDGQNSESEDINKLLFSAVVQSN